MALRMLLLHLGFVWFCGMAVHAQEAPERNVVRGAVRDAATGEPLVGVQVRVAGTLTGAATATDGRFVIAGLPAGSYTLEARMVGFSPARVEVRWQPGDRPPDVPIFLEESPVAMAEIVVSPQRPALQAVEAYAATSLSGPAIQQAKQADEDIYRAATRLPGLTASDFSSRFTVRGGEHNEVLVTLDGLELYDPFHLKDIGGGGLSIVDAGVIGRVDVLTGGFPAEYGGKMSGVLEMASIDPDAHRSSAGLSVMNARAFNQGRSKGGNTAWLVSGRRGYLDVLLDLAGGDVDFSPRYFDVFGKITHRFAPGHRVAFQVLGSGDRLRYREPLDPNDRVNTRYGNAYAWASWKAVWSSRVFARTVLSYGAVRRFREGVDIRRDDLVRFRAGDRRSFDVAGLKQDWTFEASARRLFRWGFALKHFLAGYDYANEKLVQDIPDPLRPRKVVNSYVRNDRYIDRRGTSMDLYASHRMRAGERFTGEAGLRFGTASWTADRFLDPRLNVAYRLAGGGLVRAAWGLFHQPQGIDELDVQDGARQYHRAQRARHWVLGFERAWAGGIESRLDLYAKRVHDPQPRYASLAGDVTSLFPELDDNRVLLAPDAGRSRGVELTLRKSRGERFNAWGSYALSWAEESIDGRIVPKSFDQRHALYLEVNYRPTPRLRIHASWHYHTGWRYSEADYEVIRLPRDDVLFRAHYGPLNARRFPAYHRLDVRIARDFRIQSHRLAAFVEVRNLYNRKNVRMYLNVPETLPDGSIVMQPVPEHWFPMLPAFGLRWDMRSEE